MYTVPRLKQMAKERWLRGYSKLRRPELLNLLNPPPLSDQNVPCLLDQKVPDINEPILDTPVPYISTLVLTPSKTTKVKTVKSIVTRMWANAQPDGRPAKYRWRPLFNAAKFG